MSQSTPPYVYKILPLKPGQAPLKPLPEVLPVSDLDQQDQFIHLSTSSQILSTLNRFFAEGFASVWILRVPYLGVKSVTKWESAVDGSEGREWEEGYFPHLHNGLKLGREEVDEVGEWIRTQDGWEVEGWPFGEVDVPKA